MVASQRDASFSPCRTYRYTLWRWWGHGQRFAMIIGLNPSTADETLDDPTVRRCIRFAQEWGYDGLCLTNLFAYRATAPQDMLRHPAPVGPYNDHCLRLHAPQAGVVVAAWGVHGRHRQRDRAVQQFLPRLHYLRLTKAGIPGHPLYLPTSCTPVPWETP